MIDDIVSDIVFMCLACPISNTISYDAVRHRQGRSDASDTSDTGRTHHAPLNVHRAGGPMQQGGRGAASVNRQRLAFINVMLRYVA